MEQTEEIHTRIMQTALPIANRAWQNHVAVPNDLKRFTPFQPGALPIKSFSFQIDPGLREHSTFKMNANQLWDVLSQIAKQAIETAITQSHRYDFVGLIVGHARNGDNYFDIFNDSAS